jgi:predicted nucleic acid-binding protein
VKYWDASGIVPLLVEEASTADRQSILDTDSVIVTWWATRVECASALGRLRREGSLDEAGFGAALRRLTTYAASWAEVEPSAAVRRTALRLLRVHPLRAADALQLSAALAASYGDPSTLAFISGDARLSTAAEIEGFALT